jgi:hypothetical protein
MTEYQKIRNSVVGVPVEQIVNKAGEISSTVDDITLWETVSNGAEPDLKIDDGKLALSTSTSTTIENAENITRFQKLWNRAPAAWKSGSDLVVPPMGVDEKTDWIDASSDTALFPTGTGIATNDLTWQYYLYRYNNGVLEIQNKLVSSASGSGTTSVTFPLPSGFTLTETLLSNVGTILTFNVDHNEPVSNQFVTTTASLNNTINIIRAGTGSVINGGQFVGNVQISMNVKIPVQEITDQTPIIYIADNVLSSSLGLPAPTATVAGIMNYQDTYVENEAINGSFDFNQRGAASYSVSGDYALDRIQIIHGNSTTQTISQQEFTVGQTDVSGNPENYMRSVVTTGGLSTSYGAWTHKLENLKKYSGQWVTLGVDIKADAVKDISFEYRLNFGTGGSPSAQIDTIGVKKISITDTWARYYHTFKMPDLSLYTFGTDENTSYLELLTYIDAGSAFDTRTDSLGNQSGTFEFANLDIKRINAQTGYSRAGGTYAGELLLCQRYYEKSYALETALGTTTTLNMHTGGSQAGNVMIGGFIFKVEKRTVPAMSYWSPITGTIARGHNTNTSLDFSYSGAATIISTKTVMPSGTGGPFAAGQKWYAHWAADSEL